MQKTRLTTRVLLLGAAGMVAACASGGEDADDPTLFFASTDPAASRSGLDYADGTLTNDDLAGETHTVRVVSSVADTNTGAISKAISDETLTLDLTDRNSGDFTLTLGGETLSFDNGTATRGDGSTLSGQIVQLPGDDAFVFIRLSAIELLGGRSGEITTGHLVTGFETTPGAPAITMGSATYVGGIEGLTNQSELLTFSGSFSLNANFDTGLIDGDVELNNFDALDTEGDVMLTLAPTDITGNGFAGDLTLDDCSFGTCTADAEIGGVFFGENAESLGGLLTIDLTATNGSGDIDQVSGNAGFGGSVSPP